MDSPINHERGINIQRTIKSKPLLLYAMWTNPDSPSSIVRPGLDHHDSWRDVSSWSFIAMSPSDQTAMLHFRFYKNRSSRLRTGSRSISKFSLCRTPNRMPFVRECSWLFSASIECLRSNFDWKRKKKSHLELHLCLQKFGMNSLASGN